VQAANRIDAVNEMLLAKYSLRNTTWPSAISKNNIHVLEEVMGEG
jgi:hypothetical protein